MLDLRPSFVVVALLMLGSTPANLTVVPRGQLVTLAVGSIHNNFFVGLSSSFVSQEFPQPDALRMRAAYELEGDISPPHRSLRIVVHARCIPITPVSRTFPPPLAENQSLSLIS